MPPIFAYHGKKLKQLLDEQIEDQGTYYAPKLPHIMATERAVSHYNNIKTTQRSSLSNESIHDTMHNSLNGFGTANYDQRPAVYTFLQIKDRRDSCPHEHLYKERDFVKKFFANEAGSI